MSGIESDTLLASDDEKLFDPKLTINEEKLYTQNDINEYVKKYRCEKRVETLAIGVISILMIIIIVTIGVGIIMANKN